MLFSSPVFLFGFLPVTLFIYYFSPKSVKNLILLLCSLFFYAWGEVFYLAVMLISISANYIFGLLIYKYQELSNKKLASLYVTMGVGVNMILLISFKVEKIPSKIRISCSDKFILWNMLFIFLIMLSLLWSGCKNPFLSKPFIIKAKKLLISPFVANELL